MTTMDEEYGDGSDHEVCPNCGLCKTCNDCRCNMQVPHFWILNGFPRSGKDSLAKFMDEELNSRGFFTSIISSVEQVKEAAKILGWDGNKDEHGRNALSSLKDWSSKWFDGPFNMMSENADLCGSSEVLIFMIREPEEIARFVEKYPETVTVYVARDACEQADNHADRRVEEYNYNYYIENNGDLEALKSSAKYLIEKLYK